MDKEYFASINEVSKRLSIPAHTLRYWEKQFPTAIRPTTGAGGRRYYRTETIARLETIKELLYNRGMTIAGVKKLLRDGDFPKGGFNPAPATHAPAPRPNTPDNAGTLFATGKVPTTAEIDTMITLLTAARDLLQ